MKVVVKKSFHDVNNFAKVYTEGEICVFEDSRAQSMIERGIAERYDETKAEEDVKTAKLKSVVTDLEEVKSEKRKSK